MSQTSPTITSSGIWLHAVKAYQEKSLLSGGYFPGDFEAWHLVWACKIKNKKLNKKQQKSIKKNPRIAVMYAAEILNKRWFDAEIYIVNSSRDMLEYAKNPIKGKLPERLHNQMIINAMNGCGYAKKYFDWLAGKDETTYY